MRLKVGGKEAIICSYCSGAGFNEQTNFLTPITFKRRAYWLKEASKYILVHYLEED